MSELDWLELDWPALDWVIDHDGDDDNDEDDTDDDDDSDEDESANNPIEYALLKALADLNIKEKEQEIDIRNVENTLDGVNMQYMVDFICRNLIHHMETLAFILCDEISDDAATVLRTCLTQLSTLQKLHLASGNLGNEQFERLLLGLHGNPCVKDLILRDIGLEGQVGGEILSTMMQNMSALKTLNCITLPLGVGGARALQPGIRGNQTLFELTLRGCNLGNEGCCLIVDALIEENSTITKLKISNNRLTSNSLTHLTRLLQHSKINHITLDNNPELFDNTNSTRLFADSLQNTKLKFMSLIFCQLPGHAVIALFQAAVSSKTLLGLFVYDHVRLEGQDLEHMLQIIPKMSILLHLAINLDYSDPAVVSAFHRNTSIRYLYDLNKKKIEDAGPVIADILKRNKLLRQARKFLDCETTRKKKIPSGLWPKAMERLTRDNIGAMAAYKIVQERIITWWAPIKSSGTMSVSSSNITVKRLHEHDNVKREAKSSSSSILEPQQKRPRRHMSSQSESSTMATTTAVLMDSDLHFRSREELLEMIQQQQKKIAEQDIKISEQANTIAVFVKKNESSGSGTGCSE